MNEINSTLHPIVPLRDVVVFPKIIIHLFVGRDTSVKAIKTLQTNKETNLVLVSQKIFNKNGFFQGNIEFLTEKTSSNIDIEASMKSIVKQFRTYSELNPKINQDVLSVLDDIKDPSNFADIIAS